MEIKPDANGMGHKAGFGHGLGQFGAFERSAPKASSQLVSEPDFFDEDAWASRMEDMLEAGQPDPVTAPEDINLLDQATWDSTPF